MTVGADRRPSAAAPWFLLLGEGLSALNLGEVAGIDVTLHA
jgi:hypothetical protein